MTLALTASSPKNMGKPVSEIQTILDFTTASSDGVKDMTHEAKARAMTHKAKAKDLTCHAALKPQTLYTVQC